LEGVRVGVAEARDHQSLEPLRVGRGVDVFGDGGDPVSVELDQYTRPRSLAAEPCVEGPELHV
jgi:hypothetical protein